jgi:N-acetylmuramoyl-L-alanine amidase CwlA
MAVYRYPVEQRWIPGLPQLPYRNGVGAYEGVVLHFTDNYNSTIEGEVNYMSQNWQNAFVHEFASADKSIQTANPAYLCWGCGPVGNKRFVQIELVVAHTKDDFEKSFDRWCERAAEYLFARKLGVIPAKPDGSGTLWSHADVSRYLGGTDHQDPIDYLAKWGKTWQDVINRVTAYYNGLVADSTPKPATTPTPTPAPQPQLQIKSNLGFDEDAALKVIADLGTLYNASADEKVKAAAHYAADALRDAVGIQKKNL